jgi:arabinose-5-phosphate isomerase
MLNEISLNLELSPNREHLEKGSSVSFDHSSNFKDLKDLFEKEREILNYFFDHLDIDAVNQLMILLKECKGMIIVTGVGKSGLVAEKIALTLTSTGSRAFFLSPSNALHGDIGIVRSEDLFLMFSKSGESEELLRMIPFLRNKKVKIVAIVNSQNSRLVRASDLTVVLPIERELCHFDLVPTTSTVTQMIFGDIVAVAMMTHKNFSLAEYAMNHPAGRIGRRLTLRVEDLMLRGEDIPLSAPDDKLMDALVKLSNKRCGCVLIVNEQNTLIGIFTDGDLRRALQQFGADALNSSLRVLMTKAPRVISALDMATDALAKMEGDQKHPITAMPVVDAEHKVIGLIKLHDILQSGL